MSRIGRSGWSRGTRASAYPEAAKYLQKAAELSRQQQTQAEWQQYLRGLRKTHARKRRRLEILDRLEGKPGRGKSH